MTKHQPESLHKAQRGKTTQPYFNKFLGLTLCRDGQIERGAEELRKALALNPQDRDAAKALEAIRVLNKTE